MMLRFFCVGLWFVSAVASPLTKDADGSRIFGGDIASEGQFPFAVSLQQANFGHACTFSLITTQTCLGAAHCLYENHKLVPAEEFCVIVGSNVQNEELPCEEVSSIHHHEEYNDKNPDVTYDISVVILAYPVTLGPKVKTLRLAGRDVDILGESVTALGWGYIEDGKPLPHRLRYTYMTVIDNTVCNDKGFDDLNADQVCLSGGGHSTCGGDSGGPIVLTGTDIEIAIVSYGYTEECAGDLPSVYTDVRKFIDWIKKNAEGEVNIVEQV